MSTRQERRKKYIAFLEETLKKKKLLEQDQQMQAGFDPMQQMQAPQMQQQTPGPMPNMDAAAGAPPVVSTMTFEDMVTKLNLIRAGKSFNDPNVHQKLVDLFNSLNDQEKAILDKVLSKMVDITSFKAQTVQAQPSAQQLVPPLPPSLQQQQPQQQPDLSQQLMQGI